MIKYLTNPEVTWFKPILIYTNSDINSDTNSDTNSDKSNRAKIVQI